VSIILTKTEETQCEVYNAPRASFVGKYRITTLYYGHIFFGIIHTAFVKTQLIDILHFHGVVFVSLEWSRIEPEHVLATQNEGCARYRT
jgi:hypothetical protein